MADQAVAACSIPEAVFHPDQTTVIQQHIVGDLVILGRENGKKSRKPCKNLRIHDIDRMMVHVQALLYCVNSRYRLKTLTTQCYLTTPLRNAVMSVPEFYTSK